MNAAAACARVTAHSDSSVLSHHVNASKGVGERCSGHVVAASDLHLSGISKNGTLNCVNNVRYKFPLWKLEICLRSSTA